MHTGENWCVKVDDKVYGPYTAEQLRKYAHEGRLAAWSQIAPAGSRAWREAQSETTFASFFGHKVKAKGDNVSRSFGRRDQAMADTRRRQAPAMSNFLIIFDPADGAAHRMETAVRSLGHAFLVAENVWSVTCDLTATGVRNAVAPYLTPKEPIFVVDASRGRTSWQNYAPETHAKISSSYMASPIKARAS